MREATVLMLIPLIVYLGVCLYTYHPGDPGWDLGFNATRVMLNGGAAGPGGVSGACLCRNAAASDAEIVAFTPESELADFDAVTAADIPDASEFQSDVLVPAIEGWYAGTGETAVAVPETAWLVRLQDGTSFAKVHVTGLGEHQHEAVRDGDRAPR